LLLDEVNQQSLNFDSYIRDSPLSPDFIELIILIHSASNLLQRPLAFHWDLAGGSEERAFAVHQHTAPPPAAGQARPVHQPRSKLSSPGSLSRRRAQRLRSQRRSTTASCSASRTHRTPGARRPRAGHKNRQKEAEAAAAAAAGRSCRTSTGSVTKVFPTGVALGGHKVFPWQGSARRFAEEREGSAREGKRAREKGSTRAGSSDGERRGMGKDASRLSRDGEGESHLMSLAYLLEASFNTCLLFLAIHSHLQ